MRNAVIVIGLAAGLLAAPAQAVEPPPPYDEALAKRLGADERGMKQYVLVILKRGPKEPASEADRNTLFKGHMANIKKLAAEGKLLIAGPLGKNERNYAGIFVFNVPDVKDADVLLQTDPAVAAGAFAYEAYPWYGSAALQEVTGIHNRIDKTIR